MQLADGYIDLPSGKMANVVTHLEMRAPSPLRPERPGGGCTLRRVREPDAAWYRDLFRRVGEPYLWFSRLEMPDVELLRIIRDPNDEVYVAQSRGEEAGLLELDFREEGECELTFFGLIQSAVGHGIGRWLMNRAIERAWSRPVRRFFVHTCTLDHPAALQFYVRSGFVPCRRQIEISDDPRITGVLSKSAAPEVPLL